MGPPGAPPVTDVFGALAHPIRRQLVTALAAGDKSVGELAAPLPVSPAVSQHLAVLRSVGLVTPGRHGRENRYRLQREPLADLHRWLGTLDECRAGGHRFTRDAGPVPGMIDGEVLRVDPAGQ
jgi:DNA-binding transcriptional ArsR family regulator